MNSGRSLPSPPLSLCLSFFICEIGDEMEKKK